MFTYFPHRIWVFLVYLCLVIGAFIFVGLVVTQPPIHVVEQSIEIEEGDTLIEISQELQQAGIIRSRSLFNFLVTVMDYDTKLSYGHYRFEKPQDIITVIKRIRYGIHGFENSLVILYEGMTTEQIAKRVADTYPFVKQKEFWSSIRDKEGYLFPDTYSFPENVRGRDVIKKLQATFDEKITELGLDTLSKEELRDIVIMASIVEREASASTRQEVADILWKRIEIGMPLQVDATFVYERNKGTFDLTLEDLRKDSEYNTYTRKGLPPTPISNPGFESLKAAANPQPTDYLYFLTGHDGEMYYASTFEGHKWNKARYLQ